MIEKRAFVAATAIAVAAALPLVAAAQSNTIWCSGTVKNLWVDSGGLAYIQTSWRNDYVRVCNVQESVGAVSATTCITWIALLKSALQRGANTTMYYHGAGVPATCGQMATYANSPLPYYVMLQD